MGDPSKSTTRDAVGRVGVVRMVLMLLLLLLFSRPMAVCSVVATVSGFIADC